MNIIKKLWANRHDLRYLHQTIYFNFHYLPFKQAIKLPIFVYKLKTINAKGSIIIDAPIIQRGMIKLGDQVVTLYPDNGISWDNHGGKVIFHGNCIIGGNSYLSFGKNTTVEFGDDFICSSSLKCVSYRGLKFGKSTRLGWDMVIMDTNFHPLYDMDKKEYRESSSPIIIGDYNFFGMGCKVMHGTVTPERCIFGMNTIITRNCIKEPYCVMGGSPVRILARNVMRVIGHDREEE